MHSKVSNVSSTKNLLLFFLFQTLFLLPVLLRVHSLEMNVADMGYYVNHLEYLFEEPSRIFIGHFQPVLFIVSAFYRLTDLFFNPVMCLSFFQASLIGYSGWLILTRMGALPALFFCLHPSVWSYVFFDFHPDALILPFLILFFSIDYKKAPVATFLLIAAPVLIKEIYILMSIGMCLYVFAQSNPQDRVLIRTSLASAFLLFIVFICVKFLLIPNFSNSQSKDAISIVFETLNWSSQSLELNKKIYFCVFIFAFVGLAALINPKPLLVIALPLFAQLASSNQAHLNPYSHYGLMYVVPITFALSTIINAGVLSNTLPRLIIVLAIFVNYVIFSPGPFSRFSWTDKIERFNAQSYKAKEYKLAFNAQLDVDLFKGKNISIQNNSYFPNVRKAHTVQLFPGGINKKNTEHWELPADYVVIDTSVVPFFRDRGCNRVFGECRDIEIEESYNRATSFVMRNYDLVLNSGSAYLFRRIP